MRSATFVAGAIIAAGAYLAIAATFAFSPVWIGLGILAISVIGAIGIVSAPQPQADRPA